MFFFDPKDRNFLKSSCFSCSFFWSQTILGTLKDFASSKSSKFPSQVRAPRVNFSWKTISFWSIFIKSGIFAGFHFKLNFKIWFIASQWLFFQFNGILESFFVISKTWDFTVGSSFSVRYVPHFSPYFRSISISKALSAKETDVSKLVSPPVPKKKMLERKQLQRTHAELLIRVAFYISSTVIRQN